ncbi:MAG TPA: YCF48-related protein [Chloroflexia bacterium]|nr:YCF48-related protein [Chloroflexia bacterium]
MHYSSDFGSGKRKPVGLLPTAKTIRLPIMAATSVFLLLMLLLAVGFVTQSALAATNTGTWERQSPMPTGEGLNSIDMVSSTEGWAVGEGGVILHTTDGAVTWSQQNSGTNQQLNAVRFKDASRGLAVGNVLLYTTDGGQSWLQGSTTVPIGTLYNVEFADANTGFSAFGSNTVLKTTNGGQTWATVSMPAPVGSVQFFDSTNGVAFSTSGVLHTTDGGNRWTLAPGTQGGFFINHNEGWYVSDNVARHTTDGGATWQSQSVPSDTWASDVFFSDALNGWAVGSSQNIIHTSNGGATWIKQFGGVGSAPYNRYPLNSVSFGDALHGVAVGGAGNIFSTSDGGATWTPRQSGSATYTYAIEAIDATHLWAAQSDAELLSTSDGGQNWRRLNLYMSTSSSNIGDIDFVDALTGWAAVSGDVVGGNGFLFRTTDGGQSWQNQGISSTGGLAGVEALTTQTIVAVSGHYDTIIRSTDGGTSWTLVPHPSGNAWFNNLHFVNSTTGWALGHSGGILKSTDSGATWVAQNSGVSYPLMDVAFSNQNDGWAVGSAGTVIHTTNGGNTWSPQNSGYTSGIYTVSAISPSTAWIAGYYGFVARTTDAGVTWTTESVGTRTSFYAALFLDAENGWIGGAVGGDEVGGPLAQGRIYKRTVSSAPPSSTPTSTSIPTVVATATATATATTLPPTPTRTATPTPVPDVVSISRAEYTVSKKQLKVEATSSVANVTLSVYVTSTGQFIGNLTSNGGGRYSGTLSWTSNPVNITVRSSRGGIATRAVTTK